MKFEEMSRELMEEARACKTAEACLDFLKAHHIELNEEQMAAFSGGIDLGTPPSGKSECPKNKSGHEWEFTGTTRPGKVWGELWPDYQHRCIHCGAIKWFWMKG